MLMVVHQQSVLWWSNSGISKKMEDRQWPVTDGQTLLVHWWTASGQLLWYETLGPLVDQE
jgi:hypothetical protein